MGKMTDALRKARQLREHGESPEEVPPVEVERPAPEPEPPPPPKQRKPTVVFEVEPGEPPDDSQPDTSTLEETSPAQEAPSAEEETHQPAGVLPEVETVAEPVTVPASEPRPVLPEVEPTPVDTAKTYLSVHYHKDDRTADEFRGLKNRLTAGNSAARVILVCSCGPGEGKTTVAMNLATSFASTYGEKVVLVDANILRPKIGEVLALPEEGLGQVVRGHLAPEDAAVKMDIPGLWAVPVGKSGQRTEGLLDSKPVAELLTWLRRRFTRVIVELPPMSDAPEALSLASQADVVLIPVRRGRTRRRRLRRLLEGVQTHGNAKAHCVFVDA